MRSARALSRRVTRIERGARSRPSPIAVMFGSFDLFVELHVLPGIARGELDRDDMIGVVAALRSWEHDGTWDRAFAC